LAEERFVHRKMGIAQRAERLTTMEEILFSLCTFLIFAGEIQR
jgi:hypothetical protein